VLDKIAAGRGRGTHPQDKLEEMAEDLKDSFASESWVDFTQVENRKNQSEIIISPPDPEFVEVSFVIYLDIEGGKGLGGMQDRKAPVMASSAIFCQGSRVDTAPEAPLNPAMEYDGRLDPQIKQSFMKEDFPDLWRTAVVKKDLPYSKDFQEHIRQHG
jgi:hypothetical protein